MEKANGISLESLVKLNDIEWDIRYYQKLHKEHPNDEYWKMMLTNAQQTYDAIVSRTPDFKDITLNPENISYLIDEYSKALTEQFNKFEKNVPIYWLSSFLA